jgi:signal transduction histidine kinase
MFTSASSSRKRLALVVAFLATFIVVLNITTYALYRRARTHLDEELGQRLRAIATVLAHTVETTVTDSLTTASAGSRLYELLVPVSDENLLSNIVLLAPDGTTILDLAGYSEPGEESPFVDLDFGAVALARSGIAAWTELYRAGDVYMKSAYAPVRSTAGDIIGIVGVEAGAGFFAELRGLSGVIVSISLGSLIVVAVLGIVFFRQSRSLDRAEAAVIRQENLATMGRMVANIAHEIRNPLSIIRASADRLKRRGEIDDEALSYISEEVDDLDRVLTGYLEFARADGAGERSPQSGLRILRRSLLAAHSDAGDRRVVLEEALPEEDVRIMGDANRLRQAVLNVLVNAIQSTDAGGTVTVSLARRGQRAVVEVKDTGRGIEAKDIERVTDPFYTTRVDGSGLGLSVVRSVVDEHGGSLEIDSAPGSGTRVTMTFPIA